MISPKILYRLVWLIAAATFISGVVQMSAPSYVLRLVSGQTTPSTNHFFGIIGMFMALFGGMLLHALNTPMKQSVAIYWTIWQKFGASAAVALGVERHLFGKIALAIAAFDFISGILVSWYWMLVKANKV